MLKTKILKTVTVYTNFACTKISPSQEFHISGHCSPIAQNYLVLVLLEAAQFKEKPHEHNLTNVVSGLKFKCSVT